MKVWGGVLIMPRLQGGGTHKQFRVILAGTFKEFSRQTGISRQFASDTGNAREIEVATVQPGVLFYAPLAGGQCAYKPVPAEYIKQRKITP